MRGGGSADTLCGLGARRFGVTLVGFLRGRRFNIYAGEERIAGL
jgi:formate dehydrogenase assembly factor FdhD